MGDKKMNARAAALIDQLQLSPHPEGGYYKEVYRSKDMVASSDNGRMRNAVTDIYFLLLADKPSCFHRGLHDEIWHYYEGAPLELIELQPETLKSTKTVLGVKDGALRYKHCVQGGHWQAARCLGDYSLVGCTVAPGFDFSDFKFLRDEEPARLSVLRIHPELSGLL
jgi:predicted cupin superfamily sugar epimerase